MLHITVSKECLCSCRHMFASQLLSNCNMKKKHFSVTAYICNQSHEKMCSVSAYKTKERIKARKHPDSYNRHQVDCIIYIL